MVTQFTKKDEEFMRRALELALRGTGRTSPNPMVGAVLVKQGNVIGEGWHTRWEGKHAEVEAIDSCSRSPEGATLYINLEPCGHHGKTPPCTELIVKSGIRSVMVGALDPNPLVHGKGVRFLRQHGIEVRVGLLGKEARRLNESFYHVHLRKRPLVTAKWAMSLDGKIATSTGDSKWVSGSLSRKFVHHLRARVDAILVGINTVLRDDPRLTAREKKEHIRQPARIILDSSLRIPLKARVLEGARTRRVIVVTREGASPRKRAALERTGASILTLPSRKGERPLEKLLAKLPDFQIQSLLVEGGGSVIGSFFREHLVDKVIVFTCPKIIGGLGSVSPVEGWTGIRRMHDSISIKECRVVPFGSDVCIEGYVRYRDRKK